MGFCRGVSNQCEAHKLSTNLVAIWLYPAKKQGWCRKRDKVLFVMIQSEIDGIQVAKA
jgi:hypothetical protein